MLYRNQRSLVLKFVLTAFVKPLLQISQTQDEIIAGVLLMDRDLQFGVAWNTLRHFLEMEASLE